jgi:CHAT domain-containing protein/TolA-binding protein
VFSIPFLALLLVAPPPPDLAELDRLDRDGKFAEVETRARARLAELESAGRGDSLDAAAYRRRLAESIARGGRPQDPEAVAQAQRALDAQEKLLPAGDAGLAAGYHTVAFVHSMSGRYAEALRYQEKCVDLITRHSGPDGEQTIEAQKYLGSLLLQLRDYPEAIAIYTKVLPIEEKKEGPESLTVAQTLNDLGVAYWRLAQYKEARPLLERTLAIRIRAFGENHRLVAASMHNLAIVLEPLGDLPRALDLELRAVAIREKTWPPGHPNIANGWNTVGTMYFRLGKNKEAEEALTKSLEMRRERLGPKHPDVAQSLGNLGMAKSATEPTQALELYLQSQAIYRDWARSMVRGLSEREAVTYTGGDAYTLRKAIGMAAAHPEWTEAGKLEALWDAEIRWRGLVLDEMIARKRMPSGPRVAESRSSYARLLAAGPGKDGVAAYSAALDQSRRAMERAERDSAAENLQMRDALARAEAGFKQVAAALPPGTALVAYSTYSPIDSDDLHLGAFVLLGGSVRFKPLGKADEVEKAVTAWRGSIAREAQAPGRRTALNERQSREAGAALRRLVWDPVAPSAGKANRVFVVPEGALHLVDFAALPASNGRYMVENGPLLHILETERDLTEANPGAPKGTLLALGDPDYGQTVRKPDRALPACAVPRDRSFAPLPASRLEVEQIVQLWTSSGRQGRALEGKAASEEQFKQSAAGNRVLHVAAHGFFYQDACGAGNAGNVLTYSGLALAGANRRPGTPAAEDGILTAEEISMMRLEGVEWVVLSGCDTGVGEVKTGEGVFGLRRAFQLAGAGTVIMSLWPVEDQSARQWMRALYRARVVEGSGTAEAVRSASLAQLKHLRAQGKSPHPLYWAGFVAAGSWK